MNELKPCPFCGYEGKISPFTGGKTLFSKGITVYEVKCLGCGCQTGLHHTPEEAVAKWNRRVDDFE